MGNDRGKRLPKLMTQGEFDQFLNTGDRIEVIIAAYHDMRIEQLPDNYYKYFQKLRLAYAIMLEEPVRRMARIRIQDATEMDYASVNRLIDDVQELFPKIEIANVEFERLMDINRIERLIDKIENGIGENGLGGDVHSSSLPRLYKLLFELKGTTNHDAINLPADFQLPIPQYSTDVNDMPGKSAEDITFEEI